MTGCPARCSQEHWARHPDCLLSTAMLIRRTIICLCLLWASVSAVECYPAPAADSYNGLERRHLYVDAAELLRQARQADRKGDKKKALILYSGVYCRDVSSKTPDERKHVVEAYLESGKIYYWKGHFAKALSHYVKGLKISEQCSTKPRLMELYNCIGIIYFMFKDYEKALSYWKKGLGFMKDYPDKVYAYRLEINTSYAYEMLGKVKDAYRHHAAALRIGHDGNPENVFLENYHLALIKERDGKCAEAVRLLKPLLAYADKTKLPSRFSCSAYEVLYRLYDKLGEQDSSLVYISKCITTAEKTGQMSLFPEVLKKMSELYDKASDRHKANELKARYHALCDSIYNVREFNKTKNLQFLYEMAKIENTISALNSEKERKEAKIRYQQTMMGVTLAVTLTVTLLLVVVWRQKRRLNESYRSLFSMNKKVDTIHRQLVEAELKDAPSVRPCPPEGKAEKSTRYITSNLGDEQYQRLVTRITDVMENTREYANCDFSLERLAVLVDSNSKYVSQVINGHYGKNFSSFVNDYRIRLACQMLSDTERYGNLTIRGIAGIAGYRSNTAFVNAFRKATGMTPSAYGKMAKEEKRGENGG